MSKQKLIDIVTDSIVHEFNKDEQEEYIRHLLEQIYDKENLKKSEQPTEIEKDFDFILKEGYRKVGRE
tara:strand:+ start:473 stop:676 length:204 start_codon:yes stop_codon:yes gene_type:complete